MKSSFLYRFGDYPKNTSVVMNVISAAKRLKTKLELVKINELPLSDYNKRYFGGYIKDDRNLLLNLTKYSYILCWVLNSIQKPKEEIVFLDYGGGSGMLSLLAKEYGIGTVVYDDIFPTSCQDAKCIAENLGLEADHYIPGDIDDVLVYFNKKKLVCDGIANYDVIEHIYDINDFFFKLNMLSSDKMSLFFASTANGHNPRINHKLKKMHKEFETLERPYKYGRKPTDTTRALIDIRREIILKTSSNLSSSEVDKLGSLTRGLTVPKIEKAVKNYLLNHELPKPLEHPTNTCDPYTGNWFENILNPYELCSRLNKLGFKTSVHCGYYDQPANILTRTLKVFFNFSIRLMGRYGIHLAPFYAISGKK